METQNIAMVGKALDDGNDLVECSVIHPTCPTCASLQGRIYSISGNTPGYPSLYDTAFKNGYSIIHPNCRHQFFPYNPKFHTEEENERLQRDTNRPWDTETSDINAKQREAYREQYAKAQMQMRQWNKELNAYREYKELCRQRGEDPAYKTLGSFRRAYRSEEDSAPYAKTHYVRRDAKQFEEFKKVLGAENMPETIEKFQEMKYNKDSSLRREFYLLFREKKLLKESIGQEKLPNYGKAEIATSKTKDYILNPENEKGKHKAHVIKSVLGYGREDYQEFNKLLLSKLKQYKVQRTESTEFGLKYKISMVLTGKSGRRLEVTTVWQIDNNATVPRFITLTPSKKEDK